MTDSLQFLLAVDRPEPPEPSLLGWLAAHCALADLPTVVQVAASAGKMAPHMAWPVISDAVYEVYADRRPDREDQPRGLPDAPASLAAGLRRLGRPSGTPFQDLADQEIAYLLPFLPAPSAEAQWRAVTAIQQAAHTESDWYATALAARVAPHLNGEGRSRIEALADRLHPRWGTRLAELAQVRTPWPSVAAELEASHPSLPAASDAAADLDDSTVAEVCRRTIARLFERYTAPPEADWIPLPPLHEDVHPVPAPTERALDLPGLLGHEEARHWVVSTGLSLRHNPHTPLERERCLEPATDYWFWFEIDKKVAAGSIVSSSVPIALLAGDLTVALFTYDGHIEVLNGQDTGRLRLHPDERIEVLDRPVDSPASSTRLFFPIQTPVRSGRYRLRCHLYYRQTLLQSQLVEMQVEPAAPIRAGALTAQIDYTSAIALPQDLADVQPLTLSVFINDNGDHTHSFRFLGEEGVKSQVVLGEGQLQNLIDTTRRALRKAAWGCSDEGSSGPPFLYHDGDPDFTKDLIDLARQGYRLWVAIAGKFARAALTGAGLENKSSIRQLKELMRKPGVIEIANMVGAGMVVPAALFYDHSLDPGLDLQLCPDAMTTIQSGEDLAGSPCFQGNCPSYDIRSIVCPSGFWGYRHDIGLPQSTAQAFAEEAPPSPAHGGHYIHYTGNPRCLVGVAEEFAGPHTERIRDCYHGTIHADREKLLAQLRGRDIPQLVYFFCHGSLAADGLPKLHIGDADTSPIYYENITDGDMDWPDSRPLVFLNACRTAAVEPRHAMNFVDAFIRGAHASGLIGTEITTYESLAAEFAESVLHHFMDKRTSIAQAMRAARLTLLSQQNPLGLIYVAYAPPHLQMREA